MLELARTRQRLSRERLTTGGQTQRNALGVRIAASRAATDCTVASAAKLSATLCARRIAVHRLHTARTLLVAGPCTAFYSSITHPHAIAISLRVSFALRDYQVLYDVTGCLPQDFVDRRLDDRALSLAHAKF